MSEVLERGCLIDDCVKLLRERSYKISIRKISEETELSESWINRLASKKIKNPSYSKLLKIKKYFEKQ